MPATDSPIIFAGDQAPATLTRWVKEGRARRLAPELAATFALEDPGKALAEGIKLRLPSSVPASDPEQP